MTDQTSTEQYLRDAGLRVTQARVTVIAALQELGGHPTADEVWGAPATQNGGVSRATVFNALDDLTQAGLVMIADAGPGATRYERAARWHHHFVCGGCGAITDVACIEDAPLCVDPGGVDGKVDAVQVIFRGTCAGCLGSVR